MPQVRPYERKLLYDANGKLIPIASRKYRDPIPTREMPMPRPHTHIGAKADPFLVRTRDDWREREQIAGEAEWMLRENLNIPEDIRVYTKYGYPKQIKVPGGFARVHVIEVLNYQDLQNQGYPVEELVEIRKSGLTK